jgi:hypothetical protein
MLKRDSEIKREDKSGRKINLRDDAPSSNVRLEESS